MSKKRRPAAPARATSARQEVTPATSVTVPAEVGSANGAVSAVVPPVPQDVPVPILPTPIGRIPVLDVSPLVGEAFMRAPDPGAALRALFGRGE